MFVVPRRPLWQRAINRLTHSSGIKFFPVAFESSLAEAGGGPETVFNAVYAANYWAEDESKSGIGSTIEATEYYIPRLIEALRRFGIRSMYDAPCGDLNWISPVVEEIDYIGADVATEAVDLAKQRRPDLDIRLADICTDDFPKVDLWHCRHTFYHLSFENIWQALAKAKESSIEYAALTTNSARILRNMDIKTGGYRLLDLRQPPFNFPEPLAYLRDYADGEFPCYTGIWRIRDLPI